MPNRIGIESVPDEEMEKWLQSRLDMATKDATVLTEEFLEVVELGQERNDPEIFAYARLLNHLAGLDAPTILRILSAYVWHGYKQQENK